MTEFPLPDWLNVSRETHEKLIAYCHQIERWNRSINLVSKSSVDQIWQRHLLDSAQIYRFGATDGLWLDIGSGGGLPGIVMSILGADIVLVESDQRKATFLRETARVLGLSLRVLNDRVESISPMGAKTLSARALAPLTTLLEYATYHLQDSGVAVFSKGKTAQSEIDEARKTWRFDCDMKESLTDPLAAVLVIKHIRKL
jgi:16S rRNA (guanine527-N7)-methyltransferase